MVFKDKKDLRDGRPMVIPGRILTLSGVEIGEKWKRSKLVNEMKTEAISMLAAKDMCVVEGIDENALPLSTADRFPTGANKFSQLGEATWSELLTLLLDGCTFGSQQAFLVVNLFAHWPSEFMAFAHTQQTWKMPFFSLNYCQVQPHFDWLEFHLKAQLATRLQDQTFKIPGYVWADHKAPPEHCEDAPAKPALKILVWSSVMDEAVGIPKIAFGSELVENSSTTQKLEQLSGSAWTRIIRIMVWLQLTMRSL